MMSVPFVLLYNCVIQFSAEHMLQTSPRPRFRIRLLSSSAGVQTETGDSRKVLQGNGCVVHTIVILFKLVSSLTFVKYFTALSLTSLEIFAKQATICQYVRPICKAMCLPCVIVTHFPFVVISPIQIWHTWRGYSCNYTSQSPCHQNVIFRFGCWAVLLICKLKCCG